MKKKFVFSLLILMCFLLVGCQTNTSSKEVIEGNSWVRKLRFYAPTDFTYRADLRGLAYSEADKKVFLKGDYENNPTEVIYLISALEFVNKDVKEYIDSVNTKLSDNDVKYVIKTNFQSQEIYARENYVINGVINYAYILGKEGNVYVVIVKGPQDKDSEIMKVAEKVFESLYIQ